MTWASKRQASIILVLLGLAIIPVFFIVYKISSIPPTCSDKKQNQGEVGIDCGDPCSLLCRSQVSDLVVSWKRFFLVGGGVYNVVIYAENPNVEAGAKNVGYQIRIYNTEGISIYERHGATTIPAKRSIPIIETGISLGDQIPARIEFKFDDGIIWTKQTSKESPLSASNNSLTRATSSPKLITNIINKDSISYSNIEVVAIMYNEEGNAIGASRTFIDYIDGGQTVPLTFTWPEPFKVIPTRIEIIPKVFI
jgi:hypothetical protein